jgi:CBS domain containing-hemolysin-like protein
MFNLFGRRAQKRLKYQGNCNQIIRKHLSADVPASRDRAGIRPSLRVGTLLEGRNPKTFTIPRTATIKDAIGHLVEFKSSASLVMDEKGGVIGLFTARDLLRFVNKGVNSRYDNADGVMKKRVEEAMTPADKVVSDRCCICP